MDARRVDENNLTAAGDVFDARDPAARGLGLVGDDRDLGSDEHIEEGGLAGVRTADQGNKP